MPTPETPTPSPAPLVARLRELAERATPGPWAVEVGKPDGDVCVWQRDDALKFVCRTGFNAVRSSDDDAAFIAACDPQTILTLCTALETAQPGDGPGFAHCPDCGSEDLLCLNCRSSVNRVAARRAAPTPERDHAE